jgi:hypothetical protein
MGRTRKLSSEQRDEYLDLCCAYWISECKMNEETMRENTDLYDYFDSKGLVCDDGITWLNEQYDKLNDTRQKRKEAGAKGGKAKAKKVVANAKQMLSNSQANPKQILAERKEEKEKKEKREEIERKKSLPFQSAEFLEMWDNWKKYKASEHRFKFKSEISELAAVRKLANMSGSEEEAIEIILQSIENGWKGFFNLPQKKENNAKGFNPDIDQQELENWIKNG